MFWIFWGILWDFLEEFFGKNLFGGFFSEGFLGGIFWEELMFLSRFWGNFVSMQGRTNFDP